MFSNTCNPENITAIIPTVEDDDSGSHSGSSSTQHHDTGTTSYPPAKRQRVVDTQTQPDDPSAHPPLVNSGKKLVYPVQKVDIQITGSRPMAQVGD